MVLSTSSESTALCLTHSRKFCTLKSSTWIWMQCKQFWLFIVMITWVWNATSELYYLDNNKNNNYHYPWCKYCCKYYYHYCWCCYYWRHIIVLTLRVKNKLCPGKKNILIKSVDDITFPFFILPPRYVEFFSLHLTFLITIFSSCRKLTLGSWWNCTIRL